jgi:uncharacterized membrane protein YbhN (UPF0104 family)
VSARRRGISRALRWGLALAAVAFVVWMVPVRDRCWDARSPASTRVSLSREDDPSATGPAHGSGSCVLHLRTGDVRITAEECARLRCEPGLASTWKHARPTVIAGLFAFYALGSLAWAARWRALLGFAGIDLPLGEVWRMSIEAQAGGILLPGGIGGDALRIASVAARPTVAGAKLPLAIVVASVLLDRAVGLAVVAAMAATLAFAWGGIHAGPLANVLAALPIAFVAGIALLRRAPLGRVSWLVDGRLGGIVRPVLEYVRNPLAPRAIAVATALSVLVAGVQFATIRGIVFALGGVPSAEKWVYVGIAMAFVVSAVPALPGAWGTADAAYVFFFGLAGLPAGTSLAACLLYRLFWYISGLVGAVLHVALPRSFAAPARAGPAEEPPA